MTFALLLGVTLSLAWSGSCLGSDLIVVAQTGPATSSRSAPDPSQSQEEIQKEEPREDEEDALLYRLLAAPEYVWEGFTYPIKKLSIFYERVDLLERALDFFLNEDRTGGIYPRFALGGVISTGIGFTAFENNLFKKGKKARLSYLFGVRGNQTASLLFEDPAVLGSRIELDSEVNAANFDEGRFFPNGNQAAEGDLRKFSLEQISFPARVSYPLSREVSGSFLARFFAARAEPSDRSGSQIPPTTDGVNTTVLALEWEPGLRYDSRDNEFSPSTGWLLDGAVTYTDQVNGDDFRYLGYTVEVQRYLPLYRGDRILLLRALLAKQSTINDNAIPFYELNSLDLDHGLRGFSRGRWRDRGRLLFNVEWRYPVWERMQGSLFYDVGQVFRDFRDLESRTFRYSAGMGFRFTTRQQFTFRAHLAISEDGVLAVLKGDLEFLRRRGSVLGGF